jgi:hypothetical protein
MPHRGAYDDDGDDGGEEAPWDALGRGTPAGRALFNLYNGDTGGKTHGNSSSAYNVRSDPQSSSLSP